MSIKEKLYKVISHIKRQYREPRVYSVVFESDGTSTLFLCGAYSLEEVYGQFKEYMTKKDALNASRTYQMKMWNWNTIDGLMKNYIVDTTEEVEEEKPVSAHNALIKEIIDSKNKELLEKNKDLLSVTEYQYIAEKIK